MAQEMGGVQKILRHMCTRVAHPNEPGNLAAAKWTLERDSESLELLRLWGRRRFPVEKPPGARLALVGGLGETDMSIRRR